MNDLIYILNILIDDKKKGISQKTLAFKNNKDANQRYNEIIKNFIKNNQETFDYKYEEVMSTEVKCYKKRLLINKEEIKII